jgi:hypothetical protein
MKPIRIVAISALWIAGLATALAAVTLQEAYDAAGPGEGYDKLLVLDPGTVYTGGLTVERGIYSCIHGNGALVDLEDKSVWAAGYGTGMDIDHCVLTNGYSGIYVSEDARATIRNNTIVYNQYGVSSWYGNPFNVIIENNIISENSVYGIYCREFFEPFIEYNTVWGNLLGDYMKNCG